jgi:TonB family protein
LAAPGARALQSNADDVLESYYALFKQRLRAEFEPPPGLSDSLKATVSVRSNSDGSLSNARIVRGSGSRDFDRAVLEAIQRVRMPARPETRKTETIEFIFTMRELSEG